MRKYENIQIRSNDKGVRYRSNPIYPNIPISAEDYYIITEISDRYDTLAKEFYGDSTLW
jgi:hypothetical protein